jgi:hypothetical protein
MTIKPASVFESRNWQKARIEQKMPFLTRNFSSHEKESFGKSADIHLFKIISCFYTGICFIILTSIFLKTITYRAIKTTGTLIVSTVQYVHVKYMTMWRTFQETLKSETEFSKKYNHKVNDHFLSPYL